MTGLRNKWVDWAEAHPHMATMLIMLGFVLFIFLTVITNGLAFAALGCLLVGVGGYFLIYSIITGQF